MDDVIALYWALRKDSQAYGDELAQVLGIEHSEEPAAFFGMAFNTFTLTLELLDYYNRVWANQKFNACTSAEEAREQNSERVILIQKLGFIELMSSFEYAAKNTVSSQVDRFGLLNGRIYLSRIMKLSLDIGLIDAPTHTLWCGATKLRNCLVHNNGISEETANYAYPDVSVTVYDGTMTRGNLKQFGLMSRWLLIAAKNWLNDVHCPTRQHQFKRENLVNQI